jgi:hypothetical protein
MMPALRASSCDCWDAVLVSSIRNLYLTGTDICTPGVAGALVGSRLTASAIMGRILAASLRKVPRRQGPGEPAPGMIRRDADEDPHSARPGRDLIRLVIMR